MAARSVLIALAAAAMLVTGCWSPTGPDAAVGRPFDLKVAETATLDDGFRVRFESVRSDSRCPIDAQCIRAGEAIIAVSATSARGRVESREMRTDATGSRIEVDDHAIELTALQPFPRSTHAIDPRDYIATFVVRPQ